MSQFYDLASLVVIPSGYKASTIYAQKPLTTDGQLSFSRASTATRVNSSGLIEAVSSNVPRLDYTNSSCPRLLLEPQRTNLALFSEQLDNAAWGKEGSGTGITPVVTANYTTSPDGTQNADRIQFSAVGKTLTTDYSIVGQYPITLGATGTMTWYMKSLTSSNQNVLVYWGAGEGAVFVATPQWQRFTLNNLTAGLANIAFGTRGGSGFTAGGDETLDIAFWGAQVEAGSYPTSYVKTEAAAVTRVADAASKTGISSLIGQTEGTIFVEFQTLQLNPTNVSRIILSDGTTSNYIFLGLNEAGSGNLSRLYVNNTGAGTSVSVFSSTALTVGTNKLAMAYKSGSFALYLNGNLVGSSASAVTIPATSQLVVGGQSPSATTQLETMVNKQLILFKTRLTNAQLAELTTL